MSNIAARRDQPERPERPERRPVETPDARAARTAFLRNEAFLRARTTAPLMLEAQGAALVVLFAALYANTRSGTTAIASRATTVWFTDQAQMVVLLIWVAFVFVFLAANALHLLSADSVLRRKVPPSVLAASLGVAWGSCVPLFYSAIPATEHLLLMAAIGVAAATGRSFGQTASTHLAYIIGLFLPVCVTLVACLDATRVATALLLVGVGMQMWRAGNAARADAALAAQNAHERSQTAREVNTYVKGMETANRLFAEVVTARENNARELEVAMVSAQAASAAKSEFLAYTSHEIRTPLNAIIGLTQHVLEDQSSPPLPATHRDYLQRVKNAGDSLISLINDLLDMGKIEAGKLTIIAAPFALGTTFSAVVGELDLRARAKDVRLQLDIAPDVPTMLMGDALRIRQIVQNLVSNAIKFTDHGSVVVSAALVANAGGATSDSVRLRIDVRDTGIGLTAEQQARIFERYEQADATTTQRFGGTGLGLSIVRSLVQLQGGTLGVKSALGHGSDFYVELPLNVPPSALFSETGVQPTSITVVPLSPLSAVSVHRRVLVADDNDDNRLLAKLMLERLGWTVTTAEHGEIALAMHYAAPFDLLCLDMEMPILSGLDALHALRLAEQAANRPPVPVIALSAHADDQFRDRCLKAGGNAYLTKPLRATLLSDAVNRVRQPAPLTTP